MVQDASVRRFGSSPLVSSALDRDAVVGKLADPRIAELRN